ncbi:MAG TPA: hypothetical protein VLG09_01560 [Candidatus Saccharimonadales bacterium]|nr:hypothetical protein [Candidatus Saccharimonadales bacterium]
MTQQLNPLMGSFITPEGVFSQEQLLVAQIINDYDPTLSLQRMENSTKCAVICTPNIGMPYMVMSCELQDVNQNLVAKVFAADMARLGHTSLADQLEAQESAARVFRALKAEEMIAEKQEFAATVLKSPLHTYKHDGKVYR